MSNVLAEQKRQKVLALGRLGWSLRRIEEATGVRRETASSLASVRRKTRKLLILQGVTVYF